MPIDIHWLIAVLLLGLAWRIGRWQRRHPVQPSSTAVTAAVQRLLRPRTPDDCPACRQSGLPTLQLQPRPFVHPWRARKSRRGAPKRINTEGFACPTPTCDYYRISDAQVHALVGDGTHGKYERIQTLRCQACQATFSARRDTPLAPAQNSLLPHSGRVGRLVRRPQYCSSRARLWVQRSDDYHVVDAGRGA